MLQGGDGPADQHTVRRHNITLVLRRLATGEPITRARISRVTGLNRSTVSSIATELLERGLIREAGFQQAGAIGRPALSLELHPDGGLAVGMEVAADALGVWAVDLSGAVRYRAFVRQDNRGREPRAVLGDLAALAMEATRDAVARKIAVVATLALPGLVSPDSLQLLEAPHLGWRGVEVGQVWTEVCPSLALSVDNEANLAAFAELSLGLGKHLRTFGYVSGTVGLGLGIVANGELYRGAHGFAGEFGHVTIDPHGPVSEWGTTGELETMSGQEALLRLSGIAEGPAGATLVDPNRVSVELARRAEAGDRRTLDALQEVGTTLGIGLATLGNLFDFEAIVLGGNLGALEKYLRDPIEEQLASRFLAHRWANTAVMFSTFGREAAVMGAAHTSFDALLGQGGSNTPAR